LEAENIKSEPAPISRKLIPKRIVGEKSRFHQLTSVSGEQTAQACEIAFHEKAGWSQVDSCLFLLGTSSSPPSGHCRHASIRTLEERLISLGAGWAFSVQPVLLSVWRPAALLLES
jgi:hypothetical protein